jgi:hypothetical protein
VREPSSLGNLQREFSRLDFELRQSRQQLQEENAVPPRQSRDIFQNGLHIELYPHPVLEDKTVADTAFGRYTIRNSEASDEVFLNNFADYVPRYTPTEKNIITWELIQDMYVYTENRQYLRGTNPPSPGHVPVSSPFPGIFTRQIDGEEITITPLRNRPAESLVSGLHTVRGCVPNEIIRNTVLFRQLIQKVLLMNENRQINDYWRAMRSQRRRRNPGEENPESFSPPTPGPFSRYILGAGIVYYGMTGLRRELECYACGPTFRGYLSRGECMIRHEFEQVVRTMYSMRTQEL